MRVDYVDIELKPFFLEDSNHEIIVFSLDIICINETSMPPFNFVEVGV